MPSRFGQVEHTRASTLETSQYNVEVGNFSISRSHIFSRQTALGLKTTQRGAFEADQRTRAVLKEDGVGGGGRGDWLTIQTSDKLLYK